MFIDLAAIKDIDSEAVMACKAVQKLHMEILKEYRQKIRLIFERRFEKYTKKAKKKVVKNVRKLDDEN